MTTGFQPLFSPAMNFYKFRVFFPIRYAMETTLLKRDNRKRNTIAVIN
jgi:hypothetical protein